MSKKKFREGVGFLLTLLDVCVRVHKVGGEVRVELSDQQHSGRVESVVISIFNPGGEFPDNFSRLYAAGKHGKPYVPETKLMKALELASLISG